MALFLAPNIWKSQNIMNLSKHIQISKKESNFNLSRHIRTRQKSNMSSNYKELKNIL